MGYIGYYKPFEEKYMNNLEIFNELCIVIVSYHLYLFTNYIGDPLLQYNIGWSIVGTTIGNILVNMGVIFFF